MNQLREGRKAGGNAKIKIQTTTIKRGTAGLVPRRETNGSQASRPLC
ncbi:MAG: hypothetical protein NT172_09995 [Planctomycetota bacterium]|nr:hypothetical protein [Planctomycetota bacterium]